MPQSQSLISLLHQIYSMHIILTHFVCNIFLCMFDVDIMLVDDDVDKWVNLEVTSSCNLVLFAILGISVLGAWLAQPEILKHGNAIFYQIYWILHQAMRCILFWTNNKMCWDHPPLFKTQKILTVQFDFYY